MATDSLDNAPKSAPDTGAADDRFALAVRRAQGVMTDETWWHLDPRHRSQAIYWELREIDREAAAEWRAKSDTPGVDDG